VPANLLPRTRPGRALQAGLALALSLSMLALGLATSTPALAKAKAHRGACPHSAGAHARHHGHACAKSPHKAKAKAKAKVHARNGGKRHGAQPAVTKATTQAATKKTGATATSQASSPEPASCEDGSSPLHPQDEVYECEDGSEPGCEDSSEMSVSSDGSTLLCSSPPKAGGAGEAECEAGTVRSEGPTTPVGRRRAPTLVCSTSSEATDPTAEVED
jgi:hypothetical protein